MYSDYHSKKRLRREEDYGEAFPSAPSSKRQRHNEEKNHNHRVDNRDSSRRRGYSEHGYDRKKSYDAGIPSSSTRTIIPSSGRGGNLQNHDTTNGRSHHRHWQKQRSYDGNAAPLVAGLAPSTSSSSSGRVPVSSSHAVSLSSSSSGVLVPVTTANLPVTNPQRQGSVVCHFFPELRAAVRDVGHVQNAIKLFRDKCTLPFWRNRVS